MAKSYFAADLAMGVNAIEVRSFSRYTVFVTDRALVYIIFIVLLYYVNCCRDESPRLPVPFNILSMFGDQGRPYAQDDPALHEGRIRSFAHERGNWASYIYIPCELSLIHI